MFRECRARVQRLAVQGVVCAVGSWTFGIEVIVALAFGAE